MYGKEGVLSKRKAFSVLLTTVSLRVEGKEHCRAVPSFSRKGSNGSLNAATSAGYILQIETGVRLGYGTFSNWQQNVAMESRVPCLKLKSFQYNLFQQTRTFVTNRETRGEVHAGIHGACVRLSFYGSQFSVSPRSPRVLDC